MGPPHDHWCRSWLRALRADSTVNNAAVTADPGQGGYAGCSTTTNYQTSGRLDLVRLKPGQTVCVRTTEKRFVAMKVVSASSTEAEFDVVVWDNQSWCVDRARSSSGLDEKHVDMGQGHPDGEPARLYVCSDGGGVCCAHLADDQRRRFDRHIEVADRVVRPVQERDPCRRPTRAVGPRRGVAEPDRSHSLARRLRPARTCTRLVTGLVRSAPSGGFVRGLVGEVVGDGVGGGDGLVAGLDRDGAEAAGGLHEPVDAPAGGLLDQRPTARAANTMVRWASIDSRWWW